MTGTPQPNLLLPHHGKNESWKRSELGLGAKPSVPASNPLLAFPQVSVTFFTLFLTLSLINHSWAHMLGWLPAVPRPHGICVPMASVCVLVPRQGCCPGPGISLLPSATICLVWLDPCMGVAPGERGPWGDGGHSVPRALVTSLLLALVPARGCLWKCCGGRGLGTRGNTSPEWQQRGREKEGQSVPLGCSSERQGCSGAMGETKARLNRLQMHFLCWDCHKNPQNFRTGFLQLQPLH